MTDDDLFEESSEDPSEESSEDPFEESSGTSSEKSSNDPFEELEAGVEGRPGDPFDRLDRSSETGEKANDGEQSQRTHKDREVEEPLDPMDSSRMKFQVGREPTTSPDETDPFAGIDREGDPFTDIGGAFEAVSVGAIDPERVWEDLTSAESRGSVSDKTGRIYAEVSKHAYCERCEFFSDPPAVECLNDGTDIAEFLDMETVRVVDCPVVVERRALENE